MRYTAKSEHAPSLLKIRWGVILLMLIASAFPARAAVSDAVYALTFSKDGKLSLDARGVPLEKILSQLQAETKVVCHVSREHLEKSIYVSFRSLPVYEAIKKIFRGISHACVLDTNGQLSEIFTFPNTSAPQQVNSDSKAHSTTIPQGTEPALKQETGTKADSAAPLPDPPTHVLEAFKDAMVPTPPPDGGVRKKE